MAKVIKSKKDEMRKISVGEFLKLYNKGKIDFGLEVEQDLKAQRNYVWDLNMESQLMETYLRDKITPVIYLRKNEDGSYSVIDGQQRLTASFLFINGEFKLKSSTEEIDGEIIKNKKFDDLSDEFKERILNYEFNTVIYFNIDDVDSVDGFDNLNKGIKLNVIERLRGKLGKEKVTLLEEVASHSFFEVPNITNKRFQDQDLALCFVMLASNPKFGLESTEKELYVKQVKGKALKENLKEDIFETLDYLNDAFNNKEYFKHKQRYVKKGITPIFYLAVAKAKKLGVPANDFFEMFHDVLAVNRDTRNPLVIGLSSGSTTMRNSMDKKLQIMETMILKKSKEIKKAKK